MYSARRKSFFRSLRFRIIVWYVGTVLVTVVAVLYFIRQGVATELQAEMDQVLRADLDDVVRRLKDARGGDLTNLKNELELRAEDHEHDHWFVVFMTNQEEPLWSSAKAPKLTEEKIPPDTLIDSNGYRVIQTVLHPQMSEITTIRLGASHDAIAESLQRIDRLAAIAATIMLALAPILGFVLVPQALSPLTKMAETAEQLRPGREMERLPTSNDGYELDQLADAFNRLLGRMANYLRQKHDFLNNAAHELRTPLAAIRSAVEVQLDRPHLDDEQRDVLTQVLEETAALHHLVTQLLTLASSDADRIKSHAEPVNLTSVVQDAVDMFHAVAEVSDISLTCEVKPDMLIVIEGNRNNLRQVLNNLLDNAIKFTAAGANNAPNAQRFVKVQLTHDASQTVATLKISDTGIGVAPIDLPRLGERFYRVDKARRRATGVGGTGLGLSICKAIVDAHGGKLTIESELGKGTCVIVTLPIMAVLREEANPNFKAGSD